LVKLGSPLARCTSTVTAWATKASSARLWTTAKDMAAHHASAATAFAQAYASVSLHIGALRP
jgi:hypothetical protein